MLRELIRRRLRPVVDLIRRHRCTIRSFPTVSDSVSIAGVQPDKLESMPSLSRQLSSLSQQMASDAEPLLDASAVMARQTLTPLIKAGIVPIVTGIYWGNDRRGNHHAWSRASDYTATILGYCLDAKAVWIWTDVTGVMTADPRLIPEARTIDHLSYHEAAELSYFGAKVLHPLTMVPASLKIYRFTSKHV